jgi:hypothetical protein
VRYTLIPFAGVGIATSRAAAFAYTGILIDSVNITGLLNVTSQLNVNGSSICPDPIKSDGFIVIYPIAHSHHGF